MNKIENVIYKSCFPNSISLEENRFQEDSVQWNKNLTNIRNGKDHQSIIVGTSGQNPLCLKSYKIRYLMKNFRNPNLLSFFYFMYL